MAWSMEVLRSNINKIKNVRELHQLEKEEYRMYILTPYLASLGYDVYDMGAVVLHPKISRLDVNISTDIIMTISMDSVNIPQSLSKDKVLYLAIDIPKSQFTLYTYALGVWEKLYVVNVMEDTEEMNQKYLGMMKFIVKDSILSEFYDKKHRVFTEGAVRKLISEGDFNNRFLQNIIIKEMNEPSNELITLLVTRIIENYSTDEAEDIYELLEPLKTEGLGKVIESVFDKLTINSSMVDKLDEVIKSKPSKKVTITPEPVIEEKPVIKPEKTEKEKPQIETPNTKTKVKETKPVQDNLTLDDVLSNKKEETKPQGLDLGDALKKGEKQEGLDLSQMLNTTNGNEEAEDNKTSKTLEDLLPPTIETNSPSPLQEVLVPPVVDLDEDDEEEDEEELEPVEQVFAEIPTGQEYGIDEVNANIADKEEIKIKPVQTPPRVNKSFKPSRKVQERLDNLNNLRNKSGGGK